MAPMPHGAEAGRRPADTSTRPTIVAVVDGARCTGCEICIDACPDEAISVNGIAAVDPGLCAGCGACVPECPNEALALALTPRDRVS